MSPTPPKLTLNVKNLSGVLNFFTSLWKKDKKILIQYGIIVGSLVVVTAFIFFPLLFKIHIMKTQVRNLQLEIEVSKLKIQKIPELKKKVKQYSSEMENAQKKFLKIRDLDELIGNLSKLAAKSGVVLTGSRPITDKQQVFPDPYAKKYLAASYELIFEGSYHQFGTFLSDLEQTEQLLLVRDLNIRSNNSERTDKFQCSIQMDSFVQIPQGV